MTLEAWRDVVGLEGVYQVSDQGRIRSLDRPYHPGRLLHLVSDSKSKYLFARTSHLGKRTRLYVHREVLTAFVGPSKGRWGLHRDDNHLNNTLENLYWGTQQDNIRDMWENGIFKRKTHCVHGHAMTPENQKRWRNTVQCRTCSNDQARARRARRKGVV